MVTFEILSRPFGGKLEISANWLLSRPSQWPIHGKSSEIWLLSRPLWFIKLTYFRTLCSYTALNFSKLTPFKTPALSMGNYLQIDSVKISMGDYLQQNWLLQDNFTQWILDSFQDTWESYITFSEWTHFRTIQKRKRRHSTQQHSFSDFLDSFQDPTSEIKRRQRTQDNLDRSFTIIIIP